MSDPAVPYPFANPGRSPRRYEIARSVAYGEGTRRSLDVYAPVNAMGAPTIVFFYGGSWQHGSKERYRFVASAMAGHGFVTVIADYRVYPDVCYPAFLEDAALATRWTRDHAAEVGGSRDRLFLMGHSAGAYNAAMLALDHRWLGAIGMRPGEDIAGWIGIAGPYDFLPLRDPKLATIFGGASRADTQPIAYVSRGAPPACLATGTRDRIVDPANSSRLADRLRATGSVAKLHRYRGLGHMTIIGALAFPFRLFMPLIDDIAAFVGETVSRAAVPADSPARS